jgi:hypothetical protein
MAHACKFLPAAALLMLCACSSTVPVAIVEPQIERTLEGTLTTDASGGSFEVGDGAITCAASYGVTAARLPTSVPVRCSDGRTGTMMGAAPAGINFNNRLITFRNGERALLMRMVPPDSALAGMPCQSDRRG